MPESYTRTYEGPPLCFRTESGLYTRFPGGKLLLGWISDLRYGGSDYPLTTLPAARLIGWLP